MTCHKVERNLVLLAEIEPRRRKSGNRKTLAQHRVKSCNAGTMLDRHLAGWENKTGAVATRRACQLHLVIAMTSVSKSMLVTLTRDVYPMMSWCWDSVYDAGPTSKHHWVDVPCWLVAFSRNRVMSRKSPKETLRNHYNLSFLASGTFSQLPCDVLCFLQKI